MRKLKIMTIATLLFAVMLTSVVRAQDSKDDLKTNLRSVVTAVLDAKEAEDINSYVDQINPESPLYGTARQRVGNLMDKYDLEYELSNFSYIEKSGDFQLARVSQLIKKVSGPQFRDRVLDGLWIFRKAGESWKMWLQVTLKKSFL
jgi:hypothetical protein